MFSRAETIVSAQYSEKTGYKVLPIDAASKDLGNKLSEGTKGIIRTGTVVTSTWSWEDFKYLHPVPAEALLENRALGQNPGW